MDSGKEEREHSGSSPNPTTDASKGGDGGGMNWEIGINMYTLLCIK